MKSFRRGKERLRLRLEEEKQETLRMRKELQQQQQQQEELERRTQEMKDELRRQQEQQREKEAKALAEAHKKNVEQERKNREMMDELRQKQARETEKMERQLREQRLKEQQAAEEAYRKRIKQERETQKLRERSEARRRERLAKTTPETLRNLRDLIRKRHRLDVEIWSMKDCGKEDHAIVYDKMEEADSTLVEIYEIVGGWEENAKVWQPDEWKKAQNIRKQIWEDGKRMWGDSPPWNDNDGTPGSARQTPLPLPLLHLGVSGIKDGQEIDESPKYDIPRQDSHLVVHAERLKDLLEENEPEDIDPFQNNKTREHEDESLRARSPDPVLNIDTRGDENRALRDEDSSLADRELDPLMSKTAPGSGDIPLGNVDSTSGKIQTESLDQAPGNRSPLFDRYPLWERNPPWTNHGPLQNPAPLYTFAPWNRQLFGAPRYNNSSLDDTRDEKRPQNDDESMEHDEMSGDDAKLQRSDPLLDEHSLKMQVVAVLALILVSLSFVTMLLESLVDHLLTELIPVLRPYQYWYAIASLTITILISTRLLCYPFVSNLWRRMRWHTDLFQPSIDRDSTSTSPTEPEHALQPPFPRSGSALPDCIFRVNWTCRCGHESYDNFAQLTPTALQHMIDELQSSGFIAKATISTRTQSWTEFFL